MKKLLNFILWPALAGAVFGTVLLTVPGLLDRVPTLARYLPTQDLDPAGPAEPVSYNAAIQQAAPAVVSVNSKQVVGRIYEGYSQENPFDRVLRFIKDESNSLGSGVIISPDGFIITSSHIFFQPGQTTYSEQSTVTLNDGRTLEARILILDEENDLALLKVDAEDLPSISVGSARELQVGDVVLAIGNPRNIGQSVSLGIVSALLRKDDSFVIQTDAAINPGNSGGALIDTQGNLIGINSTIVSESGGSEGIGFATPAGKAIGLMEDYLETGASGYLGVDSELIRTQASNMTLEGFLVLRVAQNSPADEAGIRAGDIITAVNDTKVKVANDGLAFVQALSSHSPGATVEIEIFRDGMFMEIPTELGIGEPIIYRVFEDNEPGTPSAPDIN